MLFSGNVTSLFKDQPLITNFTEFTNQIRKCIDSMLKEQSLIVSEKDYVELRRSLKWYKRFCDLGNLVLETGKIGSLKRFSNLSEISLLLKVHYKWMVKFIKNLIIRFSGLLMSADCKTEIQILTKMIDYINSQLFSLNDPIVKAAKKFKASMCLPLPHPSKFIADTFSKLSKVSHYLLPLKSRNKEDFEKNLVALSSVEGLHVRGQLISLWHKFFTTNSFEEEDDRCLLKCMEFCMQNHLDSKHESPMDESTTPTRTLRQTEVAIISTNLQLWPLYEYMFLLFTSNIQRVIYEQADENNKTLKPDTQLWQKWAEIPSIAINVLTISNAILVDNNDSEKTRRLTPTLTYLLARITRSSCALNDFKRISNWDGIPTENSENVSPSDTDFQVLIKLYIYI